MFHKGTYFHKRHLRHFSLLLQEIFPSLLFLDAIIILFNFVLYVNA